MKKFTKILCVLLGTVMLSMPFAACADKGKTEGDQKPPVVVDPEPKPEPQPDPKPDPEPEPQPDPKPNPEPEPEPEPISQITALYPKDGGTATLANSMVKAFIDEYVPFVSQFYNKEGVDCFANVPVTLSWKCEKATEFSVRIAEYEDMQNAETYTVSGFEVSVPSEYFRLGGEYFWNVTDVSGKIRSETFRFTVDRAPRSVEMEGVSNTRDLGGKVALGGKTVREGRVYRGAKLDDITEFGRERAKTVYKIRTDLDLRNASESKGGVLDGVNYLNYSSPYYVGDKVGIDDGGAEFEKALADALRVFTKEENYPVYMHCSIGRDRTGTLALLLYGLLGVSERDIGIDYELSFFSEAGKSKADGINHLVGKFQATTAYLKSLGNGNLYTGIENFIKKIGLTEEEIASIRNLLLS